MVKRYVSDHAQCLDGDVSRQGCGRAVCWNFPGVKWTEKALAERKRICCGPETANNVVGVHIVTGLGRETPRIRYRQLTCLCAPRAGGRYAVGLLKDTWAGRSKPIAHAYR